MRHREGIKEQRGEAEGLRETGTKRIRDKRCSEIEEEREWHKAVEYEYEGTQNER